MSSGFVMQVSPEPTLSQVKHRSPEKFEGVVLELIMTFQVHTVCGRSGGEGEEWEEKELHVLFLYSSAVSKCHS